MVHLNQACLVLFIGDVWERFAETANCCGKVNGMCGGVIVLGRSCLKDLHSVPRGS